MSFRWQGVFPAVTTQFTQDQALDLDATGRHIEALIESGVSGLVMLGSLGENVQQTPDEKLQVMELAIRASNGRVPVLSGVAECSTAMACEYARKVERTGADRVMALPGMGSNADPTRATVPFRTAASVTRLLI